MFPCADCILLEWMRVHKHAHTMCDQISLNAQLITSGDYILLDEEDQRWKYAPYHVDHMLITNPLDEFTTDSTKRQIYKLSASEDCKQLNPMFVLDARTQKAQPITFECPLAHLVKEGYGLLANYIFLERRGKPLHRCFSFFAKSSG